MATLKQGIWSYLRKLAKFSQGYLNNDASDKKKKIYFEKPLFSSISLGEINQNSF